MNVKMEGLRAIRRQLHFLRSEHYHILNKEKTLNIVECINFYKTLILLLKGVEKILIFMLVCPINLRHIMLTWDFKNIYLLCWVFLFA